MSQRILITGGLGYVGGRLAQYFVENTDHSLLLTTRKKILPDLSWLKSCEIRSLDLAEESADLNTLCKEVDCIIHLAALNETVCLEDPERALQINGEGSLRLLNAAIKNQVKRFIYFSTAHVYGAPLVGHLTEKTLPRPIHPYAITHRTAEDFVLAAHDKKLIEGVVLRLSNSFGAPAFSEVNRWTLLLNDLARQIVMEKKVTLKSTGMQYRDFIPLTEVCYAVGHVLDLSLQKIGDGLFNLGGKPLRVIEVVESLRKVCEQVLGFKPGLVFPQNSPLDHKDAHLHFDSSKLQSTGFKSKHEWDLELQNLLRFCQTSFVCSRNT